MKRRAPLLAKIAWLVAASSALTALLLFLFVGAFYEKTAQHHRGGKLRFAAQVARMVHADPSVENIRRIVEKSGIHFRYESPRLSFCSDQSLPGFNDPDIQKRRQRHGLTLARFQGRVIALHRHGDRYLMIDLEKHRGPWDTARGIIAPLAAGLALLWLAFYFLQRKLLTPLSALRDDMEAVGAGEWRQTKIRQNDEIGDLAAVFNKMQTRLRALVQSKERLLADASHELRSPLTRLRLAAEFIADEKLRANIAADIAELDELTGGILEKSRLENISGALKKTPFTAASLFAALRQKYPQARFGEAPAATINGDCAAIARAVGNLLDNALKFAAAETRVSGEYAEGELRITVEDDGPGASEEDLPHLFEPFYRADISRSRDTGGFGLGLSIAKAAVQAHGGTVSAKNKTPRGLSVTATLPAQNEN